jgi:hypothetical protein
VVENKGVIFQIFSPGVRGGRAEEGRERDKRVYVFVEGFCLLCYCSL